MRSLPQLLATLFLCALFATSFSIAPVWIDDAHARGGHGHHDGGDKDDNGGDDGEDGEDGGPGSGEEGGNGEGEGGGDPGPGGESGGSPGSEGSDAGSDSSAGDADAGGNDGGERFCNPAVASCPGGSGTATATVPEIGEAILCAARFLFTLGQSRCSDDEVEEAYVDKFVGPLVVADGTNLRAVTSCDGVDRNRFSTRFPDGAHAIIDEPQCDAGAWTRTAFTKAAERQAGIYN